MKVANSIRDLPNEPAIYTLRSGKRERSSILYVGETDNLRRRIGQHLVNRDSSVTMEGSPVKIDPSHVKIVEWWTQPDFKDSIVRGAAEQIAFKIFDPRVRSGSNGKKDSIKLSKDQTFDSRMKALFTSTPSGKLVMMTLEEIIERLLSLEQRMAELEK